MRFHHINLIIDDLGWWYMLKAPFIHKPNLDALIASGILFNYGFVSASECENSLRTMLTGKHIKDIIVNNFGENNALYVEALTQAGYETMQCGKWWAGKETAKRIFTVGGGMDWGGFGRETIDPALYFMETAVNAGKPFHLWFAPNMPHVPLTPPQEFLDLYYNPDGSLIFDASTLPIGGLHNDPQQALHYFGMVSWLDSRIGELRAKLDALEILDKTLIWCGSDNGLWLDDSKWAHAENGMRCPFVLSLPGTIPAGVQTNALGYTGDMFKTFLDYADLTAPNLWDTMSLRSLAENGGVGQAREFLCEKWLNILSIKTHTGYRLYGGPTANKPNRVYNVFDEPLEPEPSIVNTPEGQAIAAEWWPKARAWMNGVSAPLITVAPV